jgi:hypothetical protein
VIASFSSGGAHDMTHEAGVSGPSEGGH